MPRTKPLYIRLPNDMRARVEDYALAHEDQSLTDAAVSLIGMGVWWLDGTSERIRNKEARAQLEEVLREQGAEASQHAERQAAAAQRICSLERQIAQLETWLVLPVARCAGCKQLANLSQVAAKQCPTSSCASNDFEVLPAYERPLELVRDLAGLVGAARVLVGSVMELRD